MGSLRWGLVLAVGCSLLLGSVPARAIIQPCALTGLGEFSPVHPQRTDDVVFGIGLGAVGRSDAAGAPYSVLTRAVQGPGNTIVLDIVVTTDRRPFEGWAEATLAAAPALSATGSLGALDPGRYEVTADLRVFDAATGQLASPCPQTPQPLRVLVVYDSPGLASVVEFHNAGLDHYFLTQDTDEIRDLDAGVHPGWVRTGQEFLAYLPGQTAGRVPAVKRYYGLPSAGLDTHLYTVGLDAEAFSLTSGALSQSWKLERFDAFELYLPSYADGRCAGGAMPVYRLWNGRASTNHRYTTDRAIRAAMIAQGWIPEGYGTEGVVMCAPAS